MAVVLPKSTRAAPPAFPLFLDTVDPLLSRHGLAAGLSAFRERNGSCETFPRTEKPRLIASKQATGTLLVLFGTMCRSSVDL